MELENVVNKDQFLEEIKRDREIAQLEELAKKYNKKLVEEPRK